MIKKKTSHGLSDKVSDVVLVVITAIVLLIVAYAIELKTDLPAEKKPTVLSKLFPIGKTACMKAAFLYDGTPEKSGWVNDHERGRLYVQQTLGDSIITTAYPDAMASDTDGVIAQAIKECRGSA